MHNTLWNAFSVESGQCIDQGDILEKERSLFARSLGTKRLPVLLAIAVGVCQVGVVQNGLLLLQVGALEQIGLVVDAVLWRLRHFSEDAVGLCISQQRRGQQGERSKSHVVSVGGRTATRSPNGMMEGRMTGCLYVI